MLLAVQFCFQPKSLCSVSLSSSAPTLTTATGARSPHGLGGKGGGEDTQVRRVGLINNFPCACAYLTLVLILVTSGNRRELSISTSTTIPRPS